MKYGSVCSGIEAATVAWEPLGWQAAWFSEMDKFPTAVLAHHYPNVKNHGDFTTITAASGGGIDLLVGGTPCQAFSIAGKRAGLDDPRGNLTMEYLRLAERLRPRWIVWENVPGVLSIDGGRTFGAFLGTLGKLGYGFAYRVLDAKNFGVPQRRRRVFVVANLGDWRYSAAVLFERESLRGDSAKGRQERQELAGTLKGGSGSRGYPDPSDGNGGGLIVAQHRDEGLSSTGRVAHCLLAGGMHRTDFETQTLIAFSCKDSGLDAGHLSPTLRAMNHSGSHANAGGQIAVASIPPSRVRRLTPTECERLQGFPDGYTQVPYRNKSAADGPRYKALGNSMAVPVMRWIGNRIDYVDALLLKGQEIAA